MARPNTALGCLRLTYKKYKSQAGPHSLHVHTCNAELAHLLQAKKLMTATHEGLLIFRK